MKHILSAFVLLILASPVSAQQVAFSPNGGATDLVVKTVNSATKTIRVAAYSSTSKPIALALLDAEKRHVDVEIVVYKSNAGARYTAATFLANQRVPIRIDYRYAIMHDKFIIVDGQEVERGSFNFIESASSRNAENVIVISNSDVASRYTQ